MRNFALFGAAIAVLFVSACAAHAAPVDFFSLAEGMTVEMVTAMGALLPAHKRKIRGTFSVRADAGGDVKAMIADLNRDWNEFKATLDEKDKELAKKFDDYVTTDKLEKINSSVGDLQSAIDAANARLQAIALGAGQENAVDDQEYTEAFQAYFKKEHIHANLNKGAADEGGYLAPVEWDRTITDSLIEVSPMRQIASIQQISTAGFKKLFNLRGTASGWVGETTARTETNTPTFGEMTYTPGEIYANPAATQQMLDDAAVNLEMWLAGEVETEFAFQEGLAFVSGDGTNKPAGVLTYATGAANAGVHPLGAIEVHTAAAAAAVTTDEILELTYLLPSAFTQNARFTMNRATQGEVRKLKDGQGNYIWQPSFTAGQPATLVNYPVTEMAAMPNMATTAMPIAFGDFRRGYLIVDRTGVRVLRDPFTNKPFVQFYTTKRVGGGLLNPETLKILQMG